MEKCISNDDRCWPISFVEVKSSVYGIEIIHLFSWRILQSIIILSNIAIMIFVIEMRSILLDFFLYLCYNPT